MNMKYKILVVLLLFNYLQGISQETFKLRDISRYSVYTIEEVTLYMPDYDAEIKDPMYEGVYNEGVKEFIVNYKDILIDLDYAETLKGKEGRKLRKSLNIRKSEILSKYAPYFNGLKSKWHFVGVDFNSPSLLEESKKVLKKIEGTNLSAKHLTENELLNKIPKKRVTFKKLIYLGDKSNIKGDYYIADRIKVSYSYNPDDNTYKDQILEGDKDYSKYGIYNYFKSVDGSGTDFYNSDIDIYDPYAVERKPKKLTSKEKNIVNKMKIYKKEMNYLVDKIAEYRSKTKTAYDATKKGQALQKKVEALYDNNDDNYYDFMQLLDMDTKEVMVEFNQVLRGAVILFGL